jgi:protein TonB
LNRWILPVAFSFAVHLNILFMLPEASFPTPGRPAILKARLVTLPSASPRPTEPAMPLAGGTPAPKSTALPKTAKVSPRNGEPPGKNPAATGKQEIREAQGLAEGPAQPETTGIPAPETESRQPVENLVPREAEEPDILSRKSPLYPLASRRKGESGTVLILVRLDGQGQVRKASVRSSSGYPALDLSATAAVEKWKFRPGAPSLLLVPVVFRLE